MKITYPTRPTVTAHNVTVAMPAHLTYNPGFDPYAVALVLFQRNKPPVTWLCGRDLLREGLTRMAGENGGDVRVTPGPLTIGVHLSSPEGAALVVFSRDDIASFIQAVFLTVPEGDEHKHLSWNDLRQVLA